MPEESIAAEPSADNGNVPLDVEATEIAPSDPAAPKDPDAPTEPAEPAAAAAPAESTPAEPELYELPDGRKVDGVTLTKEWKENFLPEFTRKSQILASIETPPKINDKPADPLADPDYTPATYAELAAQIEKNLEAKNAAREQEKEAARKAVEDSVTEQLETVKKLDPTVNENALFLHATKYGFRDLGLAYQNMKDMSTVIKKAQKTTADNIAKRSDPVSVLPGATGARPDPSSFATAREYLRSLK